MNFEGDTLKIVKDPSYTSSKVNLQITYSIMSDELQKKTHSLSNDRNSLVLRNENGLCCSFL